MLEQTLNKTKAKTGNGMFIPTLKEARENGQLMGRMGRLKHGRWLCPRIGEDKLRESLCKGRSPVCSQQADWFCAFLQFIYSLAIGFLLGIFLRNCIWIINNSCLMFLGKKNHTSSKKLQEYTHSASLTIQEHVLLEIFDYLHFKHVDPIFWVLSLIK